MMPQAPQIPTPIAPLTAATPDMAVINGETEEPTLLTDTVEATFFKNLVQAYDKKEEFVRLAQTKKWRKHLHYWNGLQYLAWDEVAHDWRTAEDLYEENPTQDIDPALYAKVINVYKAHGEILIGALTSGVPSVRFMPSDADDPEDVQTAKAHSKIAEIIQRQNKGRLLLMKAVFILYNQGLVACYNENKTDYRFGTYEVPRIETVPVGVRQNSCPSCGQELAPQEFDPQEPPQPEPQPCPYCKQTVVPEPQDSVEQRRMQTGMDKKPKNRECLEIYGPLNVKIPIWATTQNATPYLILETEEPIGYVREVYPELAEKIQSTDYPDSWDRETRVPSLYKNDFPRGLVTVQRIWLRPWALNDAQDQPDVIKPYKDKYKDGCYVVIINKNLVAEIVPDKLDDHWTLSENPLAEILHAEPIGSPMVPMQDIENEVTNLTLETIEFGIGEIFADPQTLDFDTYPDQEIRPGQITPATAPAGKGLQEGFYEVKAASLSQEVGVFAERNKNTQQFVQGTYPSVYGGALEGGGGTAKEYEMSKASALQRLSITWIIVQEFWSKVMGKSAKSFAQSMTHDQNLVTSKGGGFLSVWVRRDELNGNVGNDDPEVSETFPISWAQKRDVLLNLLQMKDETIMGVVSHPENAGLVAQLIGVPELYIPGDDDRNKQLVEIGQMVQSEPMMGGPQGQPMSSVPVDPVLDNHPVEAEICRSWLKSEVGMDAKQNNAGGYANVLAHLKEHLFFDAQNQMAQQQQEQKKKQQGSGNADSQEMTDVGA